MSQSGAIPFNIGQNSGLSELSGAAPIVANLLVDAAGALRVRPGVRAWSDFPTAIPNASPVIGIYPWRQYVIYVTQDRKIWAWLGTGNVVALSDATAATQLDGTGRPIFTFDSTRVAITGGGAPQQWQGVGLSSRLAPAAIMPSGSPLALTHIAYLAQRFVGNDNDLSGFIQWTDPGPGAHTTWPVIGAHFSEAESSPDPVVALHANTNEFYAFGPTTMQVYSPDPAIAFTVAASIECGIAEDTIGSAAYSVIITEDGQLSWLDNNRRFVTSGGRNFDVISTPGMATTVKALSTVNDCWGCNAMLGPFDLLIWKLETEKRAFVYDKVTKNWSEWYSLDSSGNQIAFVAQSYCYLQTQNKHLIGLSDGSIGELTFDAGTDNGLTIQGHGRTGFQDRGTFNRKSCERISLQFKRGGTVPPATAPIVEVRYRDDLGNFRVAKRFSMGAAQYQPVIDSWALGMYRQRQYDLVWTGGSDFLLAGATETYSVSDV